MVPPPDNMGDEIPDFDSMSLEEQMAWLESLAKRQGAREEELMTDADLDVPIPENAEELIDEPGYVPFEGSRSAREMQQVQEQAQAEEKAVSSAEAAPPVETPKESAEVPEVTEAVAEPSFEETFAAEEAAEAMQWLDELSAQPEEIAEPLAEEPAQVAPEAAEVAEAPTAQSEDILGEAEPFEWMESLAKRQGAGEEELITAADVEVPEVSEGVQVDEPGYQPYSALDILPPDAPERAAISEGRGEDLSWLEDLAAEPDEEDVAAFLAFEEEDAETVQLETVGPEPAQAQAAPTPAPSADDPLAGMSDEEIARAQAEGRLTPQQELAWLKRQARALAEARETQETDIVPPEELPPAEPAELPGWLEELRATEEMEALAEADAVLADAEEIGLSTANLPDWLQTSETEARQPSDVLEVSLEESSIVDSLWQEQDKVGAETSSLEEALPDSELAAFLSNGLVPEEPDALAEALDEEYERRVSGDDAEPEWYKDAVAKAAEGAAPPTAEEPAQPPEQPPAVPLQEAEPLDMPDWLRGEDEEETAPAASAEAAPAEAEVAMPDWLAEEAEETPTAEAEVSIPNWLQDVESPEPETADALDWLEEDSLPETPPAPETAELTAEPKAPSEPQPEETPVTAAEEAPRPQPSPSEGKLLEQYRERLREDPDDYPTRLSLARVLCTHDDIAECLNHYEALISAGQFLEDVTADLIAVTEDNPEMPRAQRLLGDAYMRRGMLSEALEAYRRALAQL